MVDIWLKNVEQKIWTFLLAMKLFKLMLVLDMGLTILLNMELFRIGHLWRGTATPIPSYVSDKTGIGKPVFSSIYDANRKILISYLYKKNLSVYNINGVD